jgi:hypothetical protein
MASTTHLTVSAGLAADAACRHIRKYDQDGATVVGEEPQAPYLRPRSEMIWKYLDRARRPRGVLPWNCVGHLEAAPPTVATGGTVRDEVE